MERHDIHIENRHRAMPDAQALLAFWRKLRAAWPAGAARRARRGEPARHVAGALPRSPDDLPEGRGLSFLWRGGRDTLLYVARANILRERVLDHFRGGPGSPRTRKLAAEVRRVEWTETAGELGAWLLEAREVRERQPAYNRLQRGGERFTWLFEDSDAAPRLVELDAEVLRSNDAFGTYRSERDARRALEGAGARASVVLQVVRPGERPGFVFRPAGRAVARARASARSPRHCTWRASRSASCRSGSSPGRTRGR